MAWDNYLNCYNHSLLFISKSIICHPTYIASLVFSLHHLQAVVDSGALDALAICLEEFDPGVKEAAAWALGYIARHNAELAQSVVDSGAVPLLVLCIQEPELSLKRIAASALSDISKHSPGMCREVAVSCVVAVLL